MGEILEAARQHLAVKEGARILLEANPEDVSSASLEGWRQLGVGTLSLGVQSFDDEALAFLGRRHTGAEARSAVAAAVQAGFSTVSVDVIFGRPGQTVDALRRDLETAASLGPQHVSSYQLTIHQGTPFGFRAARGELREMEEDGQGDLFLETHRTLAAAGYRAYEVSNFALSPGHESRHNRKYWNHVPYLGLGPSAHSYAVGHRWWNLRKIGPWEKRLAEGRSPVEEREELTHEDLALEALMLGLRTAAGVDLERIRRCWGVDLLTANEGLIESLVREGLITHRGSALVPTLEGWAVADGLAGRFLF